MKALILAAGRGSRFGELTKEKHKTLLPVAGVPLLERILQGLKEVGIREVWIVIGYKADMIKKEIGTSYDGLKINYIYAKDWEKGNLYSLLAAKKFLKDKFILCMSDHLFEPKIVKKLLNTNSNCAVTLAVDRTRCSPEDTKVLEHNGFIIKIGKKINPSNCVDTGFFLCSSKIFKYATEAAKKGMNELSDAIQLAAIHRDARVVDVSGCFWADIDTKQDLEYVERILLYSQREEEYLPIVTYKISKISMMLNDNIESQISLNQRKDYTISS